MQVKPVVSGDLARFHAVTQDGQILDEDRGMFIIDAEFAEQIGRARWVYKTGELLYEGPRGACMHAHKCFGGHSPVYMPIAQYIDYLINDPTHLRCSGTIVVRGGNPRDLRKANLVMRHTGINTHRTAYSGVIQVCHGVTVAYYVVVFNKRIGPWKTALEAAWVMRHIHETEEIPIPNTLVTLESLPNHDEIAQAAKKEYANLHY
jgi:hypothetical protein